MIGIFYINYNLFGGISKKATIISMLLQLSNFF